TNLHLEKSINRSPLRRGLPRKQQLPRTQAMWIIRGFLLIPLALACFVLSPAPNAFGVTPAPDGGSTGANTAEGTNALFSLTSGIDNKANGYQALFHNTTGDDNTANGCLALFSNTTGNDNTANGSLALYQNTGSNNIGLGFNAGNNLTNGSGNVCIGYNVVGVAGESNTTRISNIY